MEDKIKERKEKLLNFFGKHKNKLVYLILVFIVWFGTWIRTLPMKYLQGKFPISIDDPFIFMRYSEYIVEHGKLMAVDYLRNYPLGFDMSNEVPLLAYVIAYFYKIVHFFVSSFTVREAAIWYSPIFFAFGLIVFFFTIKMLFDNKTALLASAFLAVIPPYLFRTIAGFSDKEPLGFFFLYLIFLFFVLAIKSKNIKWNIIFGVLSGLSTGLMAMSWGGVGFVLLTMPTFILLELLLDKLQKNDFYAYLGWFFSTFLFYLIFIPRAGGVKGFITSFNTQIGTVVLLCVILYKLFIKYKINFKNIPTGVLSLLTSIIGAGILTVLFFGFDYMVSVTKYALRKFLTEGQNRWALTVAESQKPYVTDWVANFGWIYFFLFIVGSIFLFYKILESVKEKKYKYGLLFSYTIFIFLFIFSNYSGNSVLNGKTGLSKFLFLGSLLLFVIILLSVYLNIYYKRKDILEEFTNFDKTYIFIFVWFLASIVAATSAIRLLFLFAPITTVLAAYSFSFSYDKIKLFKDNLYKFAGYLILIVLLYLTLFSFAKSTYASANGTGSGYSPQWQNAMSWVRDNTPKDSVFASWWDYGYTIQAEGQRATVTDPGNLLVYWNHLLGRHLLLANTSLEALEFLKTHKVNYILAVEEDIGKYPAYASIGADENFDRYSYISLFNIDLSQTKETRNETLYVFRGGMALDQDIYYNGQLIPGWSNAGVAGFILPVRNMKNENNAITADFGQPSAVIVYNNQQYNLPLECLYFDGKEYDFENASVKGCLRIIPYIEQGGKTNMFGGAFYLSEKVRNTLFGQLYLLDNNKWEGFSLAYTDNVPLAIYQGRPIGPIKIWKVDYPSYVQEKPEYLERDFPNQDLQKAR